jgi:ribosomal protein S27AE
MYVVGSPEAQFLENEYEKKCIKCGGSVFLSDGIGRKKGIKPICGNCFLEIKKPYTIEITDEIKKRTGLPKKTLKEIAKIMIEAEKERRKMENKAG